MVEGALYLRLSAVGEVMHLAVEAALRPIAVCAAARRPMGCGGGAGNVGLYRRATVEREALAPSITVANFIDL
jgi:hypothetical protein